MNFIDVVDTTGLALILFVFLNIEDGFCRTTIRSLKTTLSYFGEI